jgi:CDP-2,3-bis-(O-geranylgeranyl)-sn-glycerol synthase
MDVVASAKALLLVSAASTAAWLAGVVFAGRWSAPLDFGLVLTDDKRLLGSHKTWRGLLAGVIGCALVGRSLGLAIGTSAAFGFAALFGDALSSAIKRRLALPPGSEVLGLDQLPEALLPLILFSKPLGLGAVDVAVVALVFMGLDMLAKPLRHRN